MWERYKLVRDRFQIAIANIRSSEHCVLALICLGLFLLGFFAGLYAFCGESTPHKCKVIYGEYLDPLQRKGRWVWMTD